VAARLLHAPPSLAARGFMRRRKKKKKQQGEIRNSFLPSSFLAGGDLQNNQKTQPAVLFSPYPFSDFFFFFRSVNLDLLSSSRLAVPSSCW
jgi:hypothetical protein